MSDSPIEETNSQNNQEISESNPGFLATSNGNIHISDDNPRVSDSDPHIQSQLSDESLTVPSQSYVGEQTRTIERVSSLPLPPFFPGKNPLPTRSVLTSPGITRELELSSKHSTISATHELTSRNQPRFAEIPPVSESALTLGKDNVSPTLATSTSVLETFLRLNQTVPPSNTFRLPSFTPYPSFPTLSAPEPLTTASSSSSSSSSYNYPYAAQNRNDCAPQVTATEDSSTRSSNVLNVPVEPPRRKRGRPPKSSYLQQPQPAQADVSTTSPTDTLPRAAAPPLSTHPIMSSQRIPPLGQSAFSLDVSSSSVLATAHAVMAAAKASLVNQDSNSSRDSAAVTNAAPPNSNVAQTVDRSTETISHVPKPLDGALVDRVTKNHAPSDSVSQDAGALDASPLGGGPPPLYDVENPIECVSLETPPIDGLPHDSAPPPLDDVAPANGGAARSTTAPHSIAVPPPQDNVPQSANTAEATQTSRAPPLEDANAVPVKRKRGRPRKNPLPEVPVVVVHSPDLSQQSVSRQLATQRSASQHAMSPQPMTQPIISSEQPPKRRRRVLDDSDDEDYASQWQRASPQPATQHVPFSEQPQRTQRRLALDSEEDISRSISQSSRAATAGAQGNIMDDDLTVTEEFTNYRLPLHVPDLPPFESQSSNTELALPLSSDRGSTRKKHASASKHGSQLPATLPQLLPSVQRMVFGNNESDPMLGFVSFIRSERELMDAFIEQNSLKIDVLYNEIRREEANSKNALMRMRETFDDELSSLLEQYQAVQTANLPLDAKLRHIEKLKRAMKQKQEIASARIKSLNDTLQQKQIILHALNGHRGA